MEGNKRRRYRGIKQYWSEQILVSLVSLLIGSFLIVFFKTFLNTVPRAAIPFIATVFATLLGLTFTAFAIFTAFLPNIRVDFLKTKTLADEGLIFKFTIYLEMYTMLVSFLDYIFFGTDIFLPILYLMVLLIILSLGFFILLIRDTFLLFELARNWKIEENEHR